MKIPRLKSGDAIEVLWEDTCVPVKAGWMTQEEHTEWAGRAGSLVRSVGIYISKDKKFLHIIGDTEADNVSESSYLRPINIRKDHVNEIYKLIRQGGENARPDTATQKPDMGRPETAGKL